MPNYQKIITYQVRDLSNGNQTELHYIAGGDGLAAIYVVNTSPPSGEPEGDTFYTYTDHLGSILTLTDEDANLVYEQNFDAWGRERNPDTWDYTNATAMGSLTGFEWLMRGYTGHEHLTEFGLINMNGRIYDPILARMLSLDNYVQDATSTQGYNRYSYVINNPLKYTDPSGEIPLLAAIIIGAVVGIFIGNKIANSVGAKGFDRALYIIGGAIIGGVSGYLGAGVAAAGGIFANTSAIAAGSFSSAVGFKILSGGRSDVSIGLGAASYNIDKNDWGYLGEKGNSTLENVGYGLGALANISDVVNLYDASKAVKQASQTIKEQEQIVKDKFRVTKRDGFIGSNGKGNPEIAIEQGIVSTPETIIGKAAFQHDVAFYKLGADGPLSAVFDTRTLSADKFLLQIAVNNPTAKFSPLVIGVFTPIIGLKYGITNAHLFYPLIINRP